MSGSYFALNSKYQSLLALLDQIISGGGGGVPTNSNLAQVLSNGNSAGVSNIDVNFNDIQNCDNLQTNTINGAPVPSGAPNTLQQVLGANNITDLTAEFRDNLSTPSYINTISSTGMGNNNDLALTAGVNMTLDANIGITLTAVAGDINLNTGGDVIINGSVYPPVVPPTPTPTLSAVMTAGNKASTTLDMSGNAISNITTATATTFIGDLSGNALTSTKSTNLAGGAGGSIPYQSSANTTALLANGSSGQYLKSNGTTLAPSWDTLPSYSTPSLASVMAIGNSASTTLDMSSNAISNITTATATTFIGDLSGNSSTATRASNIAGGLGGQIPYQSAVNTTTLLANGTSGQVLTSNGTTLAPTWTTPASNATTINITDTTTTAGTYYPTFVSSAGSTQTLRADTQYLQYNPSTNTLQNPTFLVSDGTDTATQGGLSIKTTGSSPTNKQISLYSNTNTLDRYLNFEIKNSITNTQIQQTFYTGSNTNSARYILYAFNPTNSAYSRLDLNNTIGDLTGNSPLGDGTQEVGFQVDCSNNWATMYYNPDTTANASINALRIDTNGLKYGTITASQGQAGVLPAITNTLFSIGSGVNIANALNAITISNPLTLNFSTQSFKNFYNSVNITTAITINSISFSNAVAGGSYMVYITTGAGGSVQFNTAISGVKTTFSSAFTIPASSVAVMNIYYINSVYIVGINILT